jgi:predicted Holliday junction resolvase-like endonuclease
MSKELEEGIDMAVTAILQIVYERAAFEIETIMQLYALKRTGTNNTNLVEFEKKVIDEKIDSSAKNLKIDLEKEKVDAKKAIESESNMRDWIKGNVIKKLIPYAPREGETPSREAEAAIDAIIEFSADMLISADIEKAKSLSCYR